MDQAKVFADYVAYMDKMMHEHRTKEDQETKMIREWLIENMGLVTRSDAPTISYRTHLC